MTLVIGLKAKDGVVIASDSRASSTLTSNDTVQKIFRLGDHSAIGIAGDGGLAMYFLDQIKSGLNHGTGISDLAEQIRKKGKDTFNDFFEHLVPKDRPSLSLLLIGYTSEDKPEMYTLESRDNFVPRKGVTGFECIGVPYLADYLLNRLYESEIKSDAGAELCVLCIQETGSQDRGVGGPVHVATFSDTKSFKEMTPIEVKKLTQSAEVFQISRKNRFYPEDPDSGTSTPTVKSRNK
jgi:20S proteasome alpha/beta subunit